MKILIIGDIHGQFELADKTYEQIFQTHPDIDLMIQVGDFGFFPRMEGLKSWNRKQPFTHPCVFIDGNHEDHKLLHQYNKSWHLQVPLSNQMSWQQSMKEWEYLPRGTIRDGILYIGGARSIDQHLRIRDWDWFEEENLSYQDQENIFNAIDAYGKENIHTIITHDCPASFDVSEACVLEMIDGNRKFLEAIRQYVRPQRWFFGHYHKKMEGKVDETRWRCVDMIRNVAYNDYVVLEVEN